METSAVYWESRIKIYGFQKTPDLCLIELILNTDQMEECAYCIQELDDQGVRFDLTLAQRSGDNKFYLYLIVKCEWEKQITEHIQKTIQTDAGGILRVQPNVAMIHFQGPHFGDRYGIAETVFGVLIDNDIPILASGCSGSAIHLVFPENSAEAAARLLSAAFEVPRTVKYRGKVILHDPSSKY